MKSERNWRADLRNEIKTHRVHIGPEFRDIRCVCGKDFVYVYALRSHVAGLTDEELTEHAMFLLDPAS